MYKYIVLLLCQKLIFFEPIYYHMKGINNSITCYINVTVSLFFKKIFLRERSWREIVGSNTPSNLTVHLFRPWTVNIMSTKTCLYMPHRNLCIKRSKCTGRRSSGVTMYKYYIRMTFFEHITKTCKNTCSHISQILPLLHDIQVIIRLHVKKIKNLIKHFTMLTCYTYDCFKFIIPLLKLFNKRTHFNCLWSCSED